jgi:hypothetical protein
LTLPTHSWSLTQTVSDFLQDLDIYFDQKAATSKLKLPLAARATQDPFAKGRLNVENHKFEADDN